MIQLVPADAKGVRIIQNQHALYILIQNTFSIQLEEVQAYGYVITEQPLFMNTDVSIQGRTDLTNYVIDYLTENPTT